MLAGNKPNEWGLISGIMVAEYVRANQYKSLIITSFVTAMFMGYVMYILSRLWEK